MRLENLSKRLELELEEAYDIINKSNLVIFKWTLSEDIPTDYVSENIALFGYTPDDFYNGELKNYWEFVYYEDRERIKKELYWARDFGRESYKNQYRVNCKNGVIRWVEEWVIHERDDSGKLLYEKGIIRDITESVDISEKLKESESRYKELFDNASSLILTFNVNGQITSFNNSFAKMMDILDNQGTYTIEQFLSPATLDRLSDKSFFNYCMELSNQRIEIEMINKSNRAVFIEFYNRIIYKNDEIFELQSIGNDITDKKMAEAKIKFLSEHDSLTGLYNRLYFDRQMNLFEKRAFPNLCIIVGDINGLKMVNDAFGHKIGDQMLMEVSNILKATFNEKSDIVSRLSGDEFAILTLSKNIRELIEMVQLACKNLKVFPFVVDISLGFAIRKKMTQSLDGLFREADHQMYRNKLRRTKAIKMMMIDSLKAQLESSLTENAHHIERMQDLARKLGIILNLNESLSEELELTISVHDIGMVSVGKKVFEKTSKLSTNEYKEIMKHTEIGYHLLVSTPNLAGVGEYVLSHHENYDGSGYPQGLQGFEIPFISRIVAVVDSYEAMTNDRPYKKAIGHEEALLELSNQTEIKYDPNIVTAFLKCFE